MGAKKSVGAVALKAKICVDSSAGRREFPCAVRIEMPDHERGIPRQDKTQEESAMLQGRETVSLHSSIAL
jgi:hypothetical protein